MRSKYIILFFFIFLCTKALGQSIQIQSKNISINKNDETTIFENEVVVKTENKTITSGFVKYDKKKGFLILRKNIVAKDNNNNIIEADYAEYSELKKIFITTGQTKITTSDSYTLEAEDILFDNKNRFINSKNKSILKDLDGNIIYLENFEYLINENIFKSIGYIKIEDQKENVYEFSQIYIDTKKKEILGTDIKSYLNQDDFKINELNKPRIFSNSIKISQKNSIFNKSIFTLCDYRKNDKCPPWTIQASKMTHDNKKKTIYYDNAIIKVYDVPIFFLPKLAHPDPSVDRRSGFLPPSFTDSKNLGFGASIPYFFAIDKDKNFTLTSNLFFDENPLITGEYHQVFKDSSFIADLGFTEGYKKTSSTKKKGSKSHLFSKFVKNFEGENGSDNVFSLSFQDVSNDKYLKLYKIKSNLIDYNNDTLQSSLNYTYEKEDTFFGLNASIYETLKENFNDKYEYILPEITLDKNIFSNEKLGSLDLQSNFKVHNYDTNKLTNFLVNDFNWNSNEILFNTGFESKILGNFKNINYEARNVSPYKESTTSEFFGALGLLSKIRLEKINIGSEHKLTPKFLLRYAPGSMRKENSEFRLDPDTAFNINKLSNINNFETGLSSTVGFDYEINKENNSFDFSVAQIINEKENKKMPSKSSLDEKLSDLVGSAVWDVNDKFSLNYNFNLDQNYNDLNYNEIGTKLNFGSLNLDFNYLQEKKHIGKQDYLKTKVNYANSKNGLFSFETKRDLITNSAEFYNLSYEYTNDCLRAGLVYRREFYNDSELEPENSLMFKITLIPFGNINSPALSQ